MRLQLYATLRAVVGRKTLELDLPDGTPVRELVAELVRRWPRLEAHLLEPGGGLSRGVQLLVGGRSVRWLPDGEDTRLAADAVLDLFPPVAGG